MLIRVPVVAVRIVIGVVGLRLAFLIFRSEKERRDTHAELVQQRHGDIVAEAGGLDAVFGYKVDGGVRLVC